MLAFIPPSSFHSSPSSITGNKAHRSEGTCPAHTEMRASPGRDLSLKFRCPGLSPDPQALFSDWGGHPP